MSTKYYEIPKDKRYLVLGDDNPHSIGGRSPNDPLQLVWSLTNHVQTFYPMNEVPPSQLKRCQRMRALAEDLEREVTACIDEISEVVMRNHVTKRAAP